MKLPKTNRARTQISLIALAFSVVGLIVAVVAFVLK